MPTVTIYHNPRCSKSRNTLELLRQHGLQPEIVLYLETPPDAAQLAVLLKKLGMSASQILRRNEEEYKSSGLRPDSSEQDIIAALARHPKLIERPIVVRGSRAVVGRPPENVLELIA